MRGTIFSGFCFKLQKSVPFFRRSSSVEAVMGRKKKKENYQKKDYEMKLKMYCQFQQKNEITDSARINHLSRN